MKRIVTTLAALIFTVFLSASIALACPQCRAQVKSSIYNESFYNNFWVMTLPIFVIALFGIGLFYAGGIKSKVENIYGEQ